MIDIEKKKKGKDCYCGMVWSGWLRWKKMTENHLGWREMSILAGTYMSCLYDLAVQEGV